MRNALQLQVVPFGRSIIQQQYRRVPAGEILFQRKQLPTIAHGIRSQKPQLSESESSTSRLGRTRSISAVSRWIVLASSTSLG